MSDLSRRSSVQPDRRNLNTILPPGLNTHQDADSLYPGQHRPHLWMPTPQTSPLRHGFTNASWSAAHDLTQSLSSDHGHAQHSSYPSGSRHGHGIRSRSGTDGTDDHEMMSFLHAPSYPGHGNAHAEEMHDSGRSTGSHRSPTPPNEDTYTVTCGAPGQITITLSANMAVDFIKTDDRTAYLLGQSRTSSLEEVDAAHWSWFHFKVCLIAGVGFFTDAYDIFAINIAATMINYVYNQGQEPRAPLGPLLKASAPVGTLVGQLLFGRLADVAGRKRMYGVELIIIIIGTFGQALSAKGAIQTLNLYAILIIWRFIMGLGIGGDYPLSAVISSEFAPSHIRGRMMTAVFANQGWGQLSASIVGALVLLGFKNSATGGVTVTALQLQQDVDRAWRIILGLGCVPAAIALYFRLTIPETPRFTMDIERNVEQARKDIEGFLQTGKYKYDPDSMVIRVNAPRASFRDFVQYFRHWRNGMLLFGCAYSWFAIDVAFYGIGLNTDKFFCSIGFSQSVYICNNVKLSMTNPNSSMALLPNTTLFPLGSNATLENPWDYSDTFDDFINLCVANMFFSGVGLVLGYWATFCVIDNVKWGGRKRIQMMGFATLSVLFLIMGILLPHAIPKGSVDTTSEHPSLFRSLTGSKAMLALFCLAGFFLNFGPNTTTFIIPGELFPTRYRSTCHGLSAASGKLGAIISQFGIVGPLSTAHALFVFVAFTLTGLGATCLVEETNQKTLEHMSGEPQESFINGPAIAGHSHS